MVWANDDLVIQDFEDNKSLEENKWTFEGSSFDEEARNRFQEPNRGPHQHYRMSGHQGRRVLSSMSEKEIDAGTGRAVSPTFKVERNYINFLIGGGRYPGRAGLNLWVGDRLVRSATGRHSAVMKPVSFSVAEFKGREARVELVDRVANLWGHIFVDQIVQSDRPAS
ncbi:MAG: hypothetical protein AAF492_17095, partial [Verrucomicrobiota bacterium]